MKGESDMGKTTILGEGRKDKKFYLKDDRILDRILKRRNCGKTENESQTKQ